MKKILLTFTFLYIYFSSLAQEPIRFDFRSKTVPSGNLNDLKLGKYYQVIVDNINLNLYKVTLTASDTVLSKALQTPTLGNLELDAVTKAIAGIGSLSTSFTLSKSYEEFKISNDKVNFNTFDLNLTNKIEEQMNVERQSLNEYKEKLEEIAAQIDIIKMDVYKARLRAMESSPYAGNYDMEKALIAIEKVRSNIAELKSNISQSNKNYQNFSKINKKEITDDTKLSDTDKAIKEAYEKLNSTMVEAQTAVNADKANELLSSLVFLGNNKVDEYKSLPFQVKGEQTRLTLAIKPRDEKYLLQSYTTELIFPVQRKDYAAVGASFYYSNLYDSAFSNIETPINDSTSTFSFVEEAVSKGEIGIAILLRYGTKIDENNFFGVHFSFGPGVSISSNKIRPRALVGGGLSFGKKHMAAVDFGGIAGAVERKSSGLDLDKTYRKLPETTVTVTSLEFSGFISLGYIYKF